MAKFVIAGKSNCPYYAKAELVGDQLARNLPNFLVHKIVKSVDEWDAWLQQVCTENAWTHQKSPIVWRELVDRGGKAMLVGDGNAFQAYAKDYYGVTSDLLSSDLLKISAENEQTHHVITEENRRVQSTINPLNLTISNPDSSVLYYIMNEILNGSVFGKTDIFVRLYAPDDASVAALEGVRMEIEDLASEMLRNIRIVRTAREAFVDCDFVVLFDELRPKTSNSDSNNQFASGSSDAFSSTVYFNPYKQLALDIDKYAKSTCKILVTPMQSRADIFALCEVCGRYLRRINSKLNMIGNSMYDLMLAKAVIAERLQLNQAFVKNVSIIGQNYEAESTNANTNANMFFFDLTNGKVTGFDGAVWARTGTHWLNVVNMIADKEWITKEFLKLTKERELRVSEKLNRKGVLMFAQSVVNLIKYWCMPDYQDDSFYSAVVNANGSYGINEDVYLSVPIKFENGTFFFIRNYKFSTQTRTAMNELIANTKQKIAQQFSGETCIKDNKAQEPTFIIPQVVFE